MIIQFIVGFLLIAHIARQALKPFRIYQWPALNPLIAAVANLYIQPGRAMFLQYFCLAIFPNLWAALKLAN